MTLLRHSISNYGCSISSQTTASRRRKVISSPQKMFPRTETNCFTHHLLSISLDSERISARSLRIKAHPNCFTYYLLRISLDSERISVHSLRIKAHPSCFTYHLLRIKSHSAVFRANLHPSTDQMRAARPRKRQNSEHRGRFSIQAGATKTKCAAVCRAFCCEPSKDAVFTGNSASFDIVPLRSNSLWRFTQSR